MPRSVAIIGCGTAGPALATLLADAGWSVDLFERAARIDPVGAGLLLQPAGQQVLERLRIAEHVAERAAAVAQLLGHNARGRLVLDLRYRDLAPGLRGLGVHRAMLLDALLARFDRSAACLHLGAEVRGLERDGRRWRLALPDGTRGPFDLVVIADGARSSLRDALGSTRRAAEYPWGALWTIVPDREGVYPDVLRQVYDRTTRFLGFLPSGRVSLDGDPLVSVFWSVRNDAVGALRQRAFASFRDELLGLLPDAAPIVDEIGGWDAFVHARYMDVALRSPVGPGMAVIGDAAHAMSPQLGQGVTMALRDAEGLADALASTPDLDEALRTYARARRSATRFYQLGNRLSTWFFQHDWTPFALVRDTLFGPFCSTPVVKGQLLRTLAGTKTGVLASEPVSPRRQTPRSLP